MSLPARLATRALFLRPSTLRDPRAAEASAQGDGPGTPVPWWLRLRCEVDRRLVDGMVVDTLTPRAHGTGVRLVYLHGGAYIHQLITPHWAIIERLVARTGATVTVPRYHLAPGHVATDSFGPLLSLVTRLLDTGAPVVLAGDSAGGGLAASLALQLRDAGRDEVRGLLLFSPWLDVTMTNPGIARLAPRDPMLGVDGLAWCGRRWAGELDVADPRVSPVEGDLSGLPPMQVHQGGRDVFLPDARRLAERARQAGVPVDLHEAPDAFHVYVGLPVLPESRASLAAAGRFVRDVCR